MALSSLRPQYHVLVFTVQYNIYYLGQKLFAPPVDIMNLKRLCRVLRRLWFFHFHINIKYRLNLKMEEKGVVAHDCCPGLSPAGAPLPWATGSVQQAAGLRRETTPGNNPFFLCVAVHSVLQIEVEEPETSENPTQSLRFIISSRGENSF